MYKFILIRRLRANLPRSWRPRSDFTTHQIHPIRAQAPPLRLLLALRRHGHMPLDRSTFDELLLTETSIFLIIFMLFCSNFWTVLSSSVIVIFSCQNPLAIAKTYLFIYHNQIIPSLFFCRHSNILTMNLTIHMFHFHHLFQENGSFRSFHFDSIEEKKGEKHTYPVHFNHVVPFALLCEKLGRPCAPCPWDYQIYYKLSALKYLLSCKYLAINFLF